MKRFRPTVAFLGRLGVSRRMVLRLMGLAFVASLLGLLPLQFLAALGIVIGLEGRLDGAPVWVRWLTLGQPPSPALLLVGAAVLAVLSVVVRNLFSVQASNCAAVAVARLRKENTEAALGAPWGVIVDTGTTTVTDVITNDSQGVEVVFSQPLFTVVSDVFDMVLVVFLLLTISPWAPVPFLLGTPFMLLLAGMVAKRQSILMRQVRRRLSHMHGFLAACLRNLEFIKVFGVESRMAARYGEHSGCARNTEIRANRELGVFFSVQGICQHLFILTAVLVGLLVPGPPTQRATQVLLTYQYGLRYFRPLTTIVSQLRNLARGGVALERAKALGELCSDADDHAEFAPTTVASVGPGPHSLSVTGLRVHAHDGRPLAVLEALHVPAGGVGIITGITGSGKTSVLRAITGLLRAEGTVCLSGVDRSRFALSDWRSHFALAGWEDWGDIGMSLQDLVEMPEDCDIDSVPAAGSRLNMTHLLGPEHTRLGSLSAGENRRLSLLRAVSAARGVLLIDESDSNVDADTRRCIYDLLRQLRGERTILMVSHTSEFLALQPDTVVNLTAVRAGNH